MLFIIFRPNSIVSASAKVFFLHFCFDAHFFLRQNSYSLKLVHLFNWKWVNRLESVRGSSFFGQIPSFRPSKSHFFENFRFGGHFFYRQNSVSGKLVQPFDWKQVNGKDSFVESSFFGQLASFRPAKWYFLKIFVSVLRFFWHQNSDSLKLVQLFDWKWVNRLDSIRGSSFFSQIP